VLAVTVALWLVTHLEHWPGGYWPWMLFLASLLYSVSAFLKFHSMRLQRDAARKDILDRFGAIRYRFEWVGLDGGPLILTKENGEIEEGYEFGLRFRNGSAETIEYEVESLSIVMGAGYSANPNDEYLSTNFYMNPGSAHRFVHHWIKAPTNPLLGGKGEYSIIYRHPTDAGAFRTHHKFVINWRTVDNAMHPVAITQGKITHELIAEPKGWEGAMSSSSTTGSGPRSTLMASSGSKSMLTGSSYPGNASRGMLQDPIANVYDRASAMRA